MIENKETKAPEAINRASKNSRWAQIVFILLLLVLLVLLAVVVTMVRQMKPAMDADKPINIKTYIELPDRKPLPAVTLEQAGKGQISTQLMTGKWHILLFGYTFCPDVCPVELTVLHQMMDILRKQLTAEQLPQTVFISIDPDRDSPEMMAEYVTYFDPDFIGMTGSKTDLKILTMPFGISWMKQKNSVTTTGKNKDNKDNTDKKDNNNYLLSHTTTILLVNPEMKVAGLFPAPHSAQEMADVYQQVIRKEVL